MGIDEILLNIVVRIKGEKKGTGFYINENTIVTAHHVIESEEKQGKDIEILHDCEGKDILYGSISEFDKELDIAIVKIEGRRNIAFIPLIAADIQEDSKWRSYTCFDPYDDSKNVFEKELIKGEIFQNEKFRERLYDIHLGGQHLSHAQNYGDFSGCSGSPLVINSKIAGIITKEERSMKDAPLKVVSCIKLKEFFIKNNINIQNENIKTSSKYNNKILISNISEKYYRNKNFEGRKEILNDIRTSFNQGDSTVITQVIVGLGGIGKTQIANEYAYQFGNEYQIIWWINSETPELLANEYSNLAKKLDYIDENLNQDTLIRLTKERLENNSQWLLIFDNANNVEELFKYIPQMSDGHVIITSRNPNWSEIGKEIPLDVFRKDEAVSFLLKRSGQTDTEVAGKLAEDLGYLPLALEQAAAYISSKGKSISEYLKLFYAYQIKIFEGKPKTLLYSETVATTWKISFENIRNTFPEALEILNILAFLYSSDIPIDLVKKSIEFLPDKYKDVLLDQLKFDEAIEDLLKYSLISIANENISIHRLVQSVIKTNLSDEDRKYWIDIVFNTVNKEFIFDRQSIEERIKVEKIYSHAQKVLRHIEEINIISEEIIEFIRKLGIYSYEKAMYNESLTYLKSIVKINQDLCILNEYDNVDIYFFIGQIYITLEDNINAIKYLNKSLDLVNDCNEKNYELISAILSYLGVAYVNINNLEEGLNYNKQAYDLSKKHLNQNTEGALTIKFNLAKITYELGNYKGAKQYYEEMFKVEQLERFLDKQNYASMLCDYAFLLGKFGEYDNAILAIEKALTIDEEIYVKDHPNIARDLNNYGYLLKDLDRFDEAEIKLKEAIRINREIFGEKNIKVAPALSNLGMVMRELDKYDEARELYKESLEINYLYYGEKHSDVAMNYSNLGTLELMLDNIEEANLNLKKALKIDREVYGDDHIEIATDLGNIAGALVKEGRYVPARKIAEKALSIDMKYAEGNYINILRDLQLLSMISYNQGELKDAKIFTKKELDIYQKLYGNDHEIIWKTSEKYAFLCKYNNMIDEALKYYIKAVRGFESSKENYIGELLTCLSEIGVIFELKEEKRKLEFYLNKALEICNIANSQGIENILRNIYELAGNFYFEATDYEKALNYYKKALKVAKQSIEINNSDVRAISDKIMETMKRWDSNKLIKNFYK